MQRAQPSIPTAQHQGPCHEHGHSQAHDAVCQPVPSYSTCTPQVIHAHSCCWAPLPGEVLILTHLTSPRRPLEKAEGGRKAQTQAVSDSPLNGTGARALQARLSSRHEEGAPAGGRT